jgi:predicted transcriptional regulator
VGQSRNLAQPTIATLLSRLEKKGAISHRTEGRQFVYRPAVAETAVRRSMIAQLTDRLFTGDVPALISHLLADRNVSAEDLAKVKKLIAAKEQDLKDSGDASGTP